MSALSLATQSQPSAAGIYPLQPIIAGQVIRGAQTAAIGSTVIITSAAPGLYRLSYVLVVTASGTSTLTANAIYTDAAKAETIAVLSGVDVSATGTFQGSIVIENVGATNISYSVTLGGSGATWNLYIIAERLF